MSSEEKRSKADDGDGGGGEDSFAMLFTSLNLILLSFFIMLNAISIKDSARVRNAIGSLRGTFGILEGGENPWADGKHLMRSDPIETSAHKGRDMIANKVEVVLKKAGLYKGAVGSVVVRTADGLRLEFTDPIMFRPDRIEINPRLFPVLDELGEIIKNAKRRIVVRGYSDGAPPRKYPSNLALSASRASEVARYFIHATKVPPRFVRAEGRGVKHASGLKRVVEIFVPHRSLRAKLGGGKKHE